METKNEQKLTEIVRALKHAGMTPEEIGIAVRAVQDDIDEKEVI